MKKPDLATNTKESLITACQKRYVLWFFILNMNSELVGRDLIVDISPLSRCSLPNCEYHIVFLPLKILQENTWTNFIKGKISNDWFQLVQHYHFYHPLSHFFVHALCRASIHPVDLLIQNYVQYYYLIRKGEKKSPSWYLLISFNGFVSQMTGDV